MKDCNGNPLVAGNWYEHELFSGNAYVQVGHDYDGTGWFGNTYVYRWGLGGLVPVTGGLARFRIHPDDASRMLPLGADLFDEMRTAE